MLKATGCYAENGKVYDITNSSTSPLIIRKKKKNKTKNATQFTQRL